MLHAASGTLSAELVIAGAGMIYNLNLDKYNDMLKFKFIIVS